MIFVLKKSHLILALAGCIVLLALFALPSIQNAIPAAANNSNWGLSFQQGGKQPAGNASPDYLKQFNAYYMDSPDKNVIYLTFDAGFENGNTPAILDALKKHNARAAFFLVGNYIKTSPDLVKRMVEEGHILGNHSSAHLSFPDMPLEEAAADIMQLHAYVKANFGYEMTLFRPPMGEFSEQTLALAASLGYKSVFWSFAYRDWEVDNQPLTLEALNACVSRCHPGAIYLLHAVSQTNTEILGDFIDQVRAQGYTFSKFYL